MLAATNMNCLLRVVAEGQVTSWWILQEQLIHQLVV